MTSTDERGGAIDIGGLLTIDVGSELRKLSQAQLQGPWQIPTEFVRRSLRCGATEVDVELGRHRARIVDDTPGVAVEILEWVGVLVDGRRSNAERHQALTVLEASGELALLAVAGLPAQRLRVSSRGHGFVATLDYDGHVVRTGRAPDGGSPRFEVEVEGPGLDRRAAGDWLRDAVRFADATVRLDGQAVSPGFAQAFAQFALRAPLRGRLSLPAQGETAHAWLLEYGVVSGHVAIPDAPCFEAAVEYGGAANDGNASRLREALQADAATVIDQAVALMLRVATQVETLGEGGRARLARLLLHAARKQLRLPEVGHARVFRGVDGNGERLVSLAELQAAVTTDTQGGRTLLALYPTQRAEAYALTDTLVLVADEVERSLLAELMMVRMRAPDAREVPGGLRVALRQLREGMRTAMSRALDRVLHPTTGAIIADDRLAPRERELIDQLRLHLAQDPHRSVESVAYCAGAGPIRPSRHRPPVLLLPRDNPTVIACVAATAHDRQWVYPAYLTLLDRYGQPPAALRAAWLASAGAEHGGRHG
jgi:hypothetical protein